MTDAAARQPDAKAHRSGAVTAGGIMLLSLAGLGIVLVVFAGIHDLNGPPLGGWLVTLPMLFGGLATVLRGRGWRIWAGSVSWLMIAFSALMVQVALFELTRRGWALTSLSPDEESLNEFLIPNWRSYRSSMAERAVSSAVMAAVSLIPATIGAFVLWAKRKELAPDGGRTVAVMIGGVILLLFAILFGAIGLTALLRFEFGVLAFGLIMAGFLGYAALAIFRRWKFWRGLARTAAWLTMVPLVIFGIGRATHDAAEGLLGAEFFVAVFGYVLWALRRAPQSEST